MEKVGSGRASHGLSLSPVHTQVVSCRMSRSIVFDRDGSWHLESHGRPERPTPSIDQSTSQSHGSTAVQVLTLHAEPLLVSRNRGIKHIARELDGLGTGFLWSTQCATAPLSLVSEMIARQQRRRNLQNQSFYGETSGSHLALHVEVSYRGQYHPITESKKKPHKTIGPVLNGGCSFQNVQIARLVYIGRCQ